MLSASKPYYQRHRVCAEHLAAMSATVDGVDSRFCQQCGKFQPLTEFDQDKRSCRSRLKRHNNRRREQRQ
ncbi:SBP domain-containing protein, partial [Scenedesmus sp. NREL 46B-D3]